MGVRVSLIGLLLAAIGLGGSVNPAAANALSGEARVSDRPGPQAGRSSERPCGCPRWLPRERAGTVTLVGDNNVVAMEGSVVLVGDKGRLNANTGDVSSQGAVTVDTEGSEFGWDTGSTREPRSPSCGEDPAVSRVAADGPRADGPPDSQDGTSQAAAISGWEDHSLNVAGSDHIVTYDDSNLFVDRDGQINANTGDTDSSGLNVVDVSGSTVKAGVHTEGPETDEREAVTGEDQEGSEAETAQRPEPGSSSGPPPGTGGVTSVSDEGTSTAAGHHALTIGADGVDDLGVHVKGEKNIATYDDSNVVVGGTGDVNAQIGDSDTSGAVIMGVDDSTVTGGHST